MSLSSLIASLKVVNTHCAAGLAPDDYATELGTAIGSETIPPGVTIPYAGLAAPSGWLLANGQAIDRTTYVDLYNAITLSQGACAITVASPAVVTLSAHGRSTGDRIELTTTGSLPTGLTANTNYYIIYINASTFKLATTLANALIGTAINTSGTQSGTHSLRYCPWGVYDVSTFLAPDITEASPYGIGTRASGIAAHDAAILGQFKDDQKEDHTHPDGQGYSATTTGGTVQGAGSVYGPTGAASGRSGTVTRGKIIGLNFIVKT